MNYNKQFLDLMHIINSIAKEYGFINGLDWANQAKNTGEISIEQYHEFQNIHDLRNNLSHGNATEISITSNKFDIAKIFKKRLVKSKLRKDKSQHSQTNTYHKKDENQTTTEFQSKKYKRYELVNWIYIKQMLRLIDGTFDIQLDNYNIDNIRMYLIHGDELNGINVETNFKNNQTKIINTRALHLENYAVYEVPHINNTRRGYGKFLCLLHPERHYPMTVAEMNIEFIKGTEHVFYNFIGEVIFAADPHASKFDASGLWIDEVTFYQQTNLKGTEKRISTHFFDYLRTRKKAYNLIKWPHSTHFKLYALFV